MVRQYGCSKVQGYYFGRPLPVEEARAIATRGYEQSAVA
jgi:EAL domain-containing protein (putative c-di-GMP-specific phosphodiesterase class I)